VAFAKNVGLSLLGGGMQLGTDIIDLPNTIATKAMGINAPNWTYTLKAWNDNSTAHYNNVVEPGLTQNDPVLARNLGQFVGGAAWTMLEAAASDGTSLGGVGVLEAATALHIANNTSSPKVVAGTLLQYVLNKVVFGKGGEVTSQLGAAGLKNTVETATDQIATGGTKTFGPQFVQKVGISLFKDSSIGASYAVSNAWMQNNNPTVQDLLDNAILGFGMGVGGTVLGEGFNMAKGKIADRKASAIDQANKILQDNSKNNPAYKPYLTSDLIDINAPLDDKTLAANQVKTDFIVKASDSAPGQFANLDSALNYHGISLVKDLQPGDVPYVQDSEIHVSPSTSANQLYHEVGHVVEGLINKQGGDISMFKDELARLAPNETRQSEKFAIAARKVMTGRVSEEDFPFLSKAIKATFGEVVPMDKKSATDLVLNQKVLDTIPKETQPMTIGEKQIKAAYMIQKEGKGYSSENALLLAKHMSEDNLDQVLGIAKLPEPDPVKMEAMKSTQAKNAPKENFTMKGFAKEKNILSGGKRGSVTVKFASDLDAALNVLSKPIANQAAWDKLAQSVADYLGISKDDIPDLAAKAKANFLDVTKDNFTDGAVVPDQSKWLSKQLASLGKGEVPVTQSDTPANTPETDSVKPVSTENPQKTPNNVDQTTFDKNRTSAKRMYRSIGVTVEGDSQPVNAGLREIEAEFKTNQGKASALEEVNKQIKDGKITPNADGTITVYRGGRVVGENDLVSVSTSKEAAAEFGDVKRYDVSKEDVAAAGGLDTGELLVTKDSVTGKQSVAPGEIPEAMTAEEAAAMKSTKKSDNASPELSSYRQKLAEDARKANDTTKGKYKSKVSADAESEAMARTAADKQKIKDQRGGRLTKENLNKSADMSRSSLDATEQGLRNRKMGEIPTVEEMSRQQQVISNKAKNLLEMAKTFALTGSKEDKAAFDSEYQDFGTLYAAYRAGQSEVGRALELSKSPLMPRQYADEFMDVIKRVAQDNPNAGGDEFMAKLEVQMNKSLPDGFWKKFSKSYGDAWYTLAVSGPSSYERAGVDNIFTALQHDITSVLTRAVMRPQEVFGEGGLLRYISSYVEGAKKGIGEAKDIMKGDLVPSNERFFLNREPNKMFQYFGRSWAAMDRATLSASRDLKIAITKDDVKELNSDMVTEMEKGFSDKQIAEMQQESYDRNKPYADILTDHFGDQHIAYLAKRGPMKGTLGKLGEWMVNGKTKVPALWRIFTFVRTGVNVMDQELDYLPGASQWRIYKALKNDEFSKFDKGETIGKSIVGSLVTTGILYTVGTTSDYWISGYGPTSKNQRDQLYTTGWRPYSIKIAGIWVPYTYFGPLAASLALAGSYSDVRHQETSLPQDLSGQFTDAVFSWSKQTLSRSFLSNVDSFFSAFQSQDQFTKWVGGLTATLVPDPKFLTDTITKAEVMFGVDNTLKSPVGIAQIVAAKFGIDWMDKPSLDVYGDPELKSYTSGISWSMAVNDPVIQGLQAANETFGSVGTSFTVGGKKVQLNSQQQQLYSELAGQAKKTNLTQLFASDGWSSLSLEDQQKAIKSVKDKSNAYARAQLEEQIPSIIGGSENTPN
jgi:hypothetical protein